MDALVIVVIVVAVLMGLIGLGVVAGSGRTRRMDERRIHAEEVRREADFHDARAEQARAEAEERMARARREEAAARERHAEAGAGGRGARRSEVDPTRPAERRFERGEEAPPEAAAEDSTEHLQGPRDER